MATMEIINSINTKNLGDEDVELFQNLQKMWGVTPVNVKNN